MKSTYKLGIIAEILCIIFLKLKFYKILHRRMRNFYGEIDLICKKDDHIIFVEVKARMSKNYQDYQTISLKQIERIKKAAIYYMTEKKILDVYKMRFDFILIRPYSLPYHIINCFN